MLCILANMIEIAVEHSNFGNRLEVRLYVLYRFLPQFVCECNSKKLLKSVHICESYYKNKSSTFFCGSLCNSNVIVFSSFSVAACPPGKFGAGCRYSCDCQNSAECDPKTGKCRCVAGWTGTKCSDSQFLSSLFLSRNPWLGSLSP